MTTLQEHGITTTKADFWAHVFPEELRVYCYSVVDMQNFIARSKPQLVAGHSLEGEVTAAGYLVAKTWPFIRKSDFPEEYRAAFAWERATQRERGYWGEELFEWLVNTGKFRPPTVWHARRLETRAEQYAQCDYRLALKQAPVFEIKTEGADYAHGANLFVQAGEDIHAGGYGNFGKSEDGKLFARPTPLRVLK